MQWICGRLNDDHWCIGKEKVSCCSGINYCMAHCSKNIIFITLLHAS